MDLQKLLRSYTEQFSLPGEEAHSFMSPLGRLSTSQLKMRTDFSPKLSAVMLLLYKHEALWYSVLIKRPDYNGMHAGQIAFPGGKYEAGDKDYYDTAMRETEEEIGVKRNNLQFVMSLSDIYIPPSNFLVYPYVAFSEERPEFVIHKQEVAGIIEYPVHNLLKDERIGETEVMTSAGIRLKVPYFNIADETVWGATAVILSEFREILRKIEGSQ